MSAPADLDTLARRCGIQRRYVDGTGNRRAASTDAVIAVLRAMGRHIRRPEHASEELARLDAEAATRVLEPVVVFWQGVSLGVPLGPDAMSTDRLDVRVSEENGPEHAWHARPDELIRDGESTLTLPLPGAIPTGIHTLTVTAGARTHEATLLVAPTRCFAPAGHARGTGTEIGVFLPLYAVRSDRNLGVGSLGDLDRLTEWAGSVGCSSMGTLPLLTTFLDEPFEPSPYAPVSRSVFGELFIDVFDAGDRHELPALRSVLSSTGSIHEEIDRLRAQELVDYAGSWRLVRRCLEVASRDIFSAEALRARVERFERERPLIAEYARFRAALADRAASGRTPESEHRLFVCAQWLLAEQLDRIARRRTGAGCGLYLDLPIGAHREGFDAWRAPGLHAEGVSLGAPPDELFRKGQDWGFPPVVPEASRALGHRLLAEAVDRHLRLASALRIDHAAGLHRCYWVPHGLSATDGVYVHYPAEEYYALLSILSHRHEALIVGENLGTIPRYVNRGLRRHGALGMSIGQFELGASAQHPLPAPAPRTLAALNTHDMPPFAAHWRGTDLPLMARLGVVDPASVDRERLGRERGRGRVIEALRAAGLLDAHEDSDELVLEALLTHLVRAPADVVMINLEDLWLETEPQNVPGIVEGYPSWRRKASRSLDWIASDPGIQSLLRRLADDGARMPTSA